MVSSISSIFCAISTKSRDQYVQKCHDLGFGGVKEEMIGTSFLSAHYLKSIGFKGRIYVIGGEGITNELDAFGIPYVPVGVSCNNPFIHES